ncbi:MAG: FG-GAP repeat protein, partial [Flavobacteriales bacterium]|nr:FG-GAP repeat protein [Flavobacteriales bacterium]
MSTAEVHKQKDHPSSARAASAWRWFLALAFFTLFSPTPEQRPTSVAEQGSAHPVKHQPLALFSPMLFLQDGPELPDLSTTDHFEEDRMAQINEAIAMSEYHISYQEKPACLQSPNRAQDLRVNYHTDGFSLSPRVDGDRWHTQLRVRSVGHLEHEWKTSPLATITATEHRAEADHGNFKILYENDERGMRQDFLVLEKPEGHGPLMVTMHYQGDLTVTQTGEDDILFSSIDSVGNPVTEVWYKDLLAWDANNEPLHAWASVEADAIVLHVDDATAEYPVTIDPLSTTATWTGEGNQAGAWYGHCVNSAGDVNGDGRSDIIIGAPFYDGGATNGGRVFIYHGTPNGPNATVNTTIISVAAEVALGQSVATAGDVNGDGYSDVVITRETYSPNLSAVFIHHGSASGVSATPNTTITLGGVCCGTTAETAGDVNGDGYSDVIIADAAWANNRGRAYIHHGSATGLLATPTTTISGTQDNADLGNSVSSAGDVNNDGYSDVIIGQGHWTAGQQEEGRFMVYHGGPGGISATPSFTYESGQTYMFLGVSVSFAGDVNGDGYGDVIVGGPSYFDGSNTVGAAFVFYGSAVGITATGMDLEAGAVNASSFGYSVGCAGDVNGDGYADVIIGETGGFTTLPGAAFVFLGTAGGLSATPVWTGGGVQASAGYGSSVAGAGDVNGDGYSDVLVGAPRKDNSGQTDEGHVMYYQGSPNGLSFSGTRDQTLSSIFFGTSVSAAGDVNGDGYSDVIVGAPQYDGGQTNEGRAYVYYSGAGGLPITASWTIENNIPISLLGTSVSTAGDVNGDGYSDVIIGAPGAANSEAGEGLAYVYFGSAAGLGTTPWIAERDLSNAALGSSVA